MGISNLYNSKLAIKGYYILVTWAKFLYKGSINIRRGLKKRAVIIFQNSGLNYFLPPFSIKYLILINWPNPFFPTIKISQKGLLNIKVKKTS